MPSWQATALVVLAAAIVFAPSAFNFRDQVTDLSAIRVTLGEVLYRDIWTIYAPGSVYTMAGAFKLFGVHMIVGGVLGVLTSAIAVGALYRLARRVARPFPSAVVSGLFAVAFWGAGYHNTLASYPPAILFILLAFYEVAKLGAHDTPGPLRGAGLWLGLAVLFKHDVGGYACLAAAASIVLVRPGGLGEAVRTVARLAAYVMVVVALPVVLLVTAGAGPAMWQDLIVFPATQFRHVRPESFPILPPIPTDSFFETARRSSRWVILNAPTIALLLGIPGLVATWRSASVPARRVIVLALVAYAIFWSAAHVQTNTHQITMVAFAAVVGVAGVFRLGAHSRPVSRRWSWTAAILLGTWIPAMLAARLEGLRRAGLEREFVGLPRAEGIIVPPERGERLRAISRAVAEAAPPDAPVLLVGQRNDVMIYAGTSPYWLTPRRIVTPYHELHPGVTDTEPAQRRMLQALSNGPMPVIIREHRFDDAALDRTGARFRSRGVPVGATLLDEWIAEHYQAGPRFGMYEVMQMNR